MSLNDDEMVMDSSRALQVETSAIVCAAFVGVLGWDVATSLVCDIRLLCSRAWLRSPIRILSRLAYILSRYCALISLKLTLKYWFYPNAKVSYCQRMPYVIVVSGPFSILSLQLCQAFHSFTDFRFFPSVAGGKNKRLLWPFPTSILSSF